ncbi:ADP-ribosylglycohydrolase family protein [Seonamhaeicola maritimus]|uniref:ADP-ribosylglycohydrolase family protein n=1 Tax=Seonamhaeicola maritimus TaxID=2591822 RepID=A0A5C7GHM2_9FLAO|nr:ADP-ribosylglycohydrolase family protein [Seonamhaeicola maritimus]TXG36983.1 ADP-ribosylglycohydrolase family protein [Seonamhaeicola maritimus]
MIGAIIGDIVGSIYEFNNHKTKEFDLFIKESTFTDDTVKTVAVADFILDEHGNPGQPRLISYLHKWYKLYPNESYGAKFTQWIKNFDKIHYVDFEPYNSYGNGSAMRISPVADSISSMKACLENAKFVTEVSHNHIEGVKGAQATASMIVLARDEKDKEELLNYIVNKFGYDLSSTVNELREVYEYNETCQRTVPEAMICFIESTDFEDAIRNAVSIGGDSDTLACITGSIAEAYYQEIPEWIIEETVKRLPANIKRVLFNFYEEVQSQYPKIAELIFKYTL